MTDTPTTDALIAWQPEYDDRVKPFLLAEAGRRGAERWNYEDAERVIAFLLSRRDLLNSQPRAGASGEREAVDWAAIRSAVAKAAWPANGLVEEAMVKIRAALTQSKADEAPGVEYAGFIAKLDNGMTVSLDGRDIVLSNEAGEPIGFGNLFESIFHPAPGEQHHGSDTPGHTTGCAIGRGDGVALAQPAPGVETPAGMVLVPRGDLDGWLVTLKHARAFVTSGEKMHPDGVGLYDEDIAEIETTLATPIAQPVAPSREAMARAREIAATFWERFNTASHREYAAAIRCGERDDCEAVQIAILALTPDAAKSDAAEAQQ